MMTVSIVANEKKGYVSINGADAVVCPLVKDRENAYSMNIKKLGFARSFISVGALEDKEFELDEATLMTARPARTLSKGPKVISIDIPEDVLGEDEIEAVNNAVKKINEFYADEFHKKAAAPVKKVKKAPLTELEKLERQLAKILAKKEELLAADTNDNDEIVED